LDRLFLTISLIERHARTKQRYAVAATQELREMVCKERRGELPRPKPTLADRIVNAVLGSG
jgi:hypothetical protein